MPAATDSSLVRLIPRPDGSMAVHSYDTGTMLGVIPACALERRGEPLPDLEQQVETATTRREQQRLQDFTAGLVIAGAFVAGVVVGILLSYV